MKAAETMESIAGQRIRLRPLRASDASALVEAASDGELWNLPFTVVPSSGTVDGYIRTALAGCEAGTVMPFVIEIKDTGQVVGSTRLWKIDRQNRKLEIGSSWIAASWQKTFVNTEAKWLLLRYAFESGHCVRVQFTTDVINEKSRKAILRLGATQEGIVRHERIMPNGRKRNSVRFSIIDDEWPAVGERLQIRLAQSGAAPRGNPALPSHSCRTVNVLAISGSLRAASLNTALLRAAARLAPTNIRVKLYCGLGELPLFNPDIEASNPAPVACLRAAIVAADALLIASPEYAHGITGVMKNALDWMVGCEAFVNKPVALINTSPRAVHAQAALRETVTMMSASIVEEASITVPLLGSHLDEDGIVSDPQMSFALRAALVVLRAAVVGGLGRIAS
jgi:NAD(P)H-dependent FMN reductase/RimJ/RimL family protein N-acetyltransferase